MSTIPYISWIGHGAADLAPPATFTGATMTLFGIATDTTAVQKLVDALLNPAGGGRVRYTPALPTAMLSFSDSPKCTSQVDQIGWSPGREAMILLPLWEYLDGQALPNRLVFWVPYIYSPIALTNFYDGAPLFDQFTVEITTCESRAIVTDLLGIAPSPGTTSLSVTFATWAKVDYAALPGAAVVVTT